MSTDLSGLIQDELRRLARSEYLPAIDPMRKIRWEGTRDRLVAIAEAHTAAAVEERDRLRAALDDIVRYHWPRGDYCDTCGGGFPCYTRRTALGALGDLEPPTEAP